MLRLAHLGMIPLVSKRSHFGDILTSFGGSFESLYFRKHGLAMRARVDRGWVTNVRPAHLGMIPLVSKRSHIGLISTPFGCSFESGFLQKAAAENDKLNTFGLIRE